MKIENYIVNSSLDGLGLSMMVISPDIEPKGVVHICHGMCGNKERFEAFGTAVADDGFVVVINDHRGHGASVRSVSERGYMNGVGADGMVNDIKDINDWIHTKYPGKEVYLLGHSMGSLLARAYVKRWDDTVDKLVICSSPSNNKMAGLGEVLCSIMPKRARSKFLTNIVSSGLNSKFRSEGIKNAWLTRDRESLESYNNNPDVGFIFTNDGYIAFLGLMKQCYSEDGWVVKNPHLPILYLSGGDDPCMKGEDKFMEAISHMCVVGYDTVNYIIYEDMRHEILNEIGKQQVWSDILEFLNE